VRIEINDGEDAAATVGDFYRIHLDGLARNFLLNDRLADGLLCICSRRSDVGKLDACAVAYDGPALHANVKKVARHQIPFGAPG
jgi:hypothetical protein